MKEKENLENKIMNCIKSGRVKLKSRYIFLAEKLGLGSGLIFSILLAILSLNTTLFYMKETDNFIYLTFGPNGFLAFFESFPYILIISFIIVVFLAGFLVTKMDFSYKKSFGQWSVYLIAFVIIIGAGLTFATMDKKLKEHHQMFAYPFFENRLPLGKGMAGFVMEKSGSGIVLNTKQGFKYISFEYIKNNTKLDKNDFIIVVGDKRDDVFYANDFKIIDDPNKMVLITREPRMNNDGRDCIDNCLDHKILLHDCFHKCEDARRNE